MNTQDRSRKTQLRTYLRVADTFHFTLENIDFSPLALSETETVTDTVNITKTGLSLRLSTHWNAANETFDQLRRAASYATISSQQPSWGNI